MYSFPSTSHMWDPGPRSMKIGLRPTDFIARTGLLTPPGIYVRASPSSSLLVASFTSYSPQSAQNRSTTLGETIADQRRRASPLRTGPHQQNAIYHKLCERLSKVST